MAVWVWTGFICFYSQTSRCFLSRTFNREGRTFHSSSQHFLLVLRWWLKGLSLFVNVSTSRVLAGTVEGLLCTWWWISGFHKRMFFWPSGNTVSGHLNYTLKSKIWIVNIFPRRCNFSPCFVCLWNLVSYSKERKQCSWLMCWGRYLGLGRGGGGRMEKIARWGTSCFELLTEYSVVLFGWSNGGGWNEWNLCTYGG